MPFPLQLLGGPGDLLRIPGMRVRTPGVRTPSTFPGRLTMPRSLSDPIQPPDTSRKPANGTVQSASAPDDPGAPDAPPVSSYGSSPLSRGLMGLSGRQSQRDASGSAPTQSAMAPEVSGTLPTSDLLRQPNLGMTPAEQKAMSDLQTGPPRASGARRVAGGIVRGLAYAGFPNLLGAADDITGVSRWRSGVENDLTQAGLARDAVNRAAQMQNTDLQRQEAQARIAESQQRAKDAELNAQRTSYDRRMKDIRSVGGFEAPEVPPSVDTYQAPADSSPSSTNLPMSPLLLSPGMRMNGRQLIPPSVTRYQTETPVPLPQSETDAVRNLPQQNLILSPGLRPQQSSSLGTVEQVTDPDAQVTRNMVRPNQRTQQEMQQAGWPKVTPEMASTLDDMGLQEGTPLPPATYNKLLKAMQTRQTQAQKPGPVRRPISVAPGHQLVDDSGNVIYTSPGKPQADQQKPPSRSQFAGVEAKKQAALARAEVDARRRLRGSATQEPEDPETVYADLRDAKQAAQNAYEAELEALSGNAPGHFEYPAAGSANTPSPAPSQPAGQPGARTVSEAELRRQAAAAGKDPDAAVQVARRRGYQLAK